VPCVMHLIGKRLQLSKEYRERYKKEAEAKKMR
jgi:hypothetical protein